MCYRLPTCVLVCSITIPVPADEPSAIDAAVERAIAKLAEQQLPSGAWPDRLGRESIGLTSLTALAFMAAGHEPGDEKPHGPALIQAAKWIVSKQATNGIITDGTTYGRMYQHGIAALMLAEVARALPKKDNTVRPGLAKAVGLTLRVQAVEKIKENQGGWRYRIDSTDSDLSATGWQVFALVTAKEAGVDVPKASLDQATAFVKRCAIRKGGFGYMPRGPAPSPTRFAIGIAVLEVLGEHRDPLSAVTADLLVEDPIEPTENWLYDGLFHAALAGSRFGGERGKAIRDHAHEQLLKLRGDDGLWTPARLEGGYGPTYASSLAILALSIEHRRLLILGPPDDDDAAGR